MYIRTIEAGFFHFHASNTPNESSSMRSGFFYVFPTPVHHVWERSTLHATGTLLSFLQNVLPDPYGPYGPRHISLISHIALLPLPWE